MQLGSIYLEFIKEWFEDSNGRIEMMFEDIKTITLIGAGDMGHGIAELALMAGYKVFLYDITMEFVEKGKQRIDWSLKKFTDKGQISSSDHEKFMKHLYGTSAIQEAVEQTDLVIEAAPENLDLKKRFFRILKRIAPKILCLCLILPI